MRIHLSAKSPLVALAFTSTCLFSQTPSTIQFSAPHVIPYANSATYTLSGFAVGDMNGDGKTDIVLGTSSYVDYGPIAQFQLLKGDGKGGFTSSMLSISAPTVGKLLIADLNKDGHQDVIHAYGASHYQDDDYDGYLTVYLGDGHGNVHQSYQFPLPPGSATAVTGDFNHDGKPDILVSTDDANPNDGPYTQEDIFLGHGDGTFTHTQSIIDNSGENEGFGAIGDFNGDGKLDFTMIDVALTGDAFRVFNGNGDGTFQLPQQDTYAFDSDAVSMSAMDFNHDGKTDLVVALGPRNSPGAQPRVATLLAKQAGGFYWYTATSVPDGAAVGSLADLDGDGKADYLYEGYKTGAMIEALKGLGNGRFSTPQNIFTGNGGYSGFGFPVAAPLTSGGRPAIFIIASPKQSRGYLAGLLNESK